jgi:colanic acid/amylovoran biosynthesis glycosyltransferase
MMTVAYLANQFPSPVEPYVGDEIEELQRRGIRVVASSVRKARTSGDGQCQAEIVLQPLRVMILLRATWLSVRHWKQISDLIWRAVCYDKEWRMSGAKALLHTWLGAYYAVMLADREIDHIHVHHGYFGSWIAMVASRLLGVGFSMTLHGSDLLMRAGYLDVKLANCAFCLTVSEYNRRYILEHYPEIQQEKAKPAKVIVTRLGVEVAERSSAMPPSPHSSAFTLLAVGRLHAVKDHAFLVRACAQLEAQGLAFEGLIAGDGPERRALKSLIRKCDLENRVTLLGHVPREQMDSLYGRADVVVLTSRSEGLPLVLMEAMARGKIVLAPAITGVPELVVDGKTGFLYEAGSLDDFLSQLLFIHSLMQQQVDTNPCILSAARQLDWVRHAAQVQVRHNFNRKKNLESFGDLFVQWIAQQIKSPLHENFVLQQIQLSVQRHRSVPVRTDGIDAVAGP